MKKGKKGRASAIDRLVGQRLRQLRHLRGISQTQVGEMIGLTFQQIQKYENGTNRIAADRLYRLAKALNVELDWFFQGAEPRGRPPAVPITGLDRQTLRFASHFASIKSPTVRRQIGMLVKALAKGGK